MDSEQMITAGGAVDVIEPYWRLDEPNYYRNVGTDNCEYIKLYQQAGFQPTLQQQDWHFRMSDLNSWYLPAHSFFEFDFRFVDKGGADGDSQIAKTANLIFPSDMRTIFKNVQLDLNSVAVESNNQNAYIFYNIDRAFMSRQYIETAGSMAGMFLHDIRHDSPALLGQYAYLQPALTLAGIDPTTSSIIGPYDGNAARLQTYAKKQVLSTGVIDGQGDALPYPAANTRTTLRVAMSDIFSYFRYWTRCIKGIDMQCRFTTVGDAFGTDRTRDEVGGAAPRGLDTFDFEWLGNGITWWMKSLKPSPRVEAGLNAMLQKGAEIFCPFETAKVYNFQPEPGPQSYRIVNESSRPTKMMVCFQRKTVLSSTDDISVIQMPAGMSSFTAFINGKKIPNIDIKVRSTEPPPHAGYKNFVINSGQADERTIAIPSGFDYTELYHRYLMLTGTFNSQFKNNYSKGSGALGYVDWSSVSPFVTFDLTPNALGDISGSNSEIVFQYNHSDVANATPLSQYTMYAVVYTERTVSLNLSESSSYVAIR